MTTATITTDIQIGPFKIPSNGQNMIMNDYARRSKISIEFVIPEPIMSNELATTLWCHEDYKFSISTEKILEVYAGIRSSASGFEPIIAKSPLEDAWTPTIKFGDKNAANIMKSTVLREIFCTKVCLTTTSSM